LINIATSKLLSPINKDVAALMVAFAVIFVPIDFIALANKLNILSLLDMPNYRSVFTTDQLLG
jgi:hypothetical protein